MAIINDSFKYLLLVCISIQTVLSANQMVVYWGQNSAGSFTNKPSEQEKDLRNYCQDSSYDIIVIGFVYLFPSATGNADSTLPGMNFANHCEVPFDQRNPYVLNCTQNIAPDIQYCQARGKKIFLSFGGGVGNYGFTSDAQAITFASTVWNMFLGGNGAIRPFGASVFDGIDLDIEGGTTTGYIKFIATLRAYFAAQTSRTYYISSAPQCFYPDRLGPGAGTPLTEAWHDYIWIQFYNNHCGLDEYPQNFNFAKWAAGMATAANPNVKLFIGAPASADAAASGFVSLSTLQTIATAISAAYPKLYGGMMVWDISTSDLNNDFAVSVAAFVHASNSVTVPTSPVTPTAPATPSTTGRVTTAAPAVVITPSPVVVVSPTPAPVVVSPTPAPVSSTSTSSDSVSCTIGNMKCLTATTYSTCSHGLWSVAQSCGANTQCSQTGQYIYCIASNVISTPTSPISVPTPVPAPVVIPTPATPAPVVTPTPAPVTPTPASSSTSTSASPVVTPTPTTPVVVPVPSTAIPTTGSCNSLGYQQCVGSASYQTCSNGRNGFEWAAAQACQKGLQCYPSATANNIYCY